MAHKITMYQCDFCRKKYASKSYAEKNHEPFCIYNPVRKSCITCTHFSSANAFDLQKCDLSTFDISEKIKVECSLHVEKDIED